MARAPGGGEVVDGTDDAEIDNPQNDDSDAVNPSQLEDDELFLRIKRQFIEARNASNDWRKEAREDYAFYAGEQWNLGDIATLREQMRPVITFNRVQASIDTVVGLEANNRQEIHAYPRTSDDYGPADMMTQAVKWARDECDAEDEESDMGFDLFVTGMGWQESRMDFDQDPDGLFCQERVDPLEMYWDPYARKRNLGDRRWQIHAKQMDIEEARAMFPGAEDDELDANWAASVAPDAAEGPHDQTEARFYRNDQSGREKSRSRKITVVHYQWYENAPIYSVRDPGDGQVKRFNPGKYKLLQERLKTLGIDLPAVKQSKRIYKRAFVGAKILEQGDCPCRQDFSFQAVTGKRDRNKRQFYGIVRAMKDPQRWANKFFSTILHNIATQGKGIIAEKDAFADAQKAEADWGRPDAIVWAKPGSVAGNKIIPKPAGQFPQGLPDMLQFALQSLRDVTGINVEMMGLADRDQPASLEWQRRKSAYTILGIFFDSIRHFRKAQGRVTIYMIQQYIKPQRLIRITGQDGNPQYIPLMLSPDFVEYDVIVDDAPSSPDQKETTWMVLGQMMPLLAKLPIPAQLWGEILKQSPLPDSFATKATNILQEQASQPQQPDPKVELQKMESASDAAYQQGQLQIEAAKLKIEQEKAAAAVQMKQLDLEADARRNHQELVHKQLIDGMKFDHERGLAEAKMAFEQQHAAIKLTHEQQLQRIKAETDSSNQKTVGKQSEGIGKLADGIGALHEATQALMKHIAAPKEIVRDHAGRPVGIRHVTIQ